MRRLFGVIITAAVLTGLGILGQGVAFAGPQAAPSLLGLPCVPGTSVFDPILGTCQTQTSTTPTSTTCSVVGQVFDSITGVCETPVHRGGPGDHRGDRGGIYCPQSVNCGGSGPIPAGGNFRGRFQGRTIILDDGSNLDACDGSDSYTVFLDRHSPYRDRLTRDFGNGSSWWDNLHNSCSVSTTQTTTNGDCTTVTTYLNDYRDSVNRWNGLANQYRGARFSRTSPQWQNLDNAFRDRVRWQNAFNTARPQVSNNTTCTVPAALPPVQLAAPPATYTAPAASSVPQGHVDTGGWSVAAWLAHNRVN